MNKDKNKIKDFNVLKWIREVRDSNYEKYKYKSSKEYIELINKKADEYIEKKRKVKQS